MTAAQHYVTGRDLLHNKFSATVHKSILDRFWSAIRQRQVVLSQFGIPADVLSLLTPAKDSDTAGAESALDLECLAYCFYHFVMFKIWEEKNATQLFSLSKIDHEDEEEKSIVFYQSKLAVSMNCLVIKASIGRGNDSHNALLCFPPGAVRGFVSGGNPNAYKRVLFLSPKQVPSDNALQGTWFVAVDMRRVPLPTAADSSNNSSSSNSCSGMSSIHSSTNSGVYAPAAKNAMADLFGENVVEFRLSLKTRSELQPVVYRTATKLPPATARPTGMGSRADSDACGDDDLEDVFAPSTAAKTEEDNLFCAALRFAPPELSDGIADPPLLPRDPTSYPLPPNVDEGPVNPSYQPYALPPPEVHRMRADGEPTFRCTVQKVNCNQSMGSRGQYTQFINISVKLLNLLEQTLTLEVASFRMIASEEVMSKLKQTATGEAHSDYKFQVEFQESREEVVSIPAKQFVVVSIRGSCKVLHRSGGSDNFERSLLDPIVFPQPAKFSVTLRDCHVKEEVQELIVEQYNADRELPTRESFLKSRAGDQYREDDVLAFAAVDDTDGLRRYCAALVMGTHDRSGEPMMRLLTSNCEMYLTQLFLSGKAYRGFMDGSTRVECTNLSAPHVRLFLLISDDKYPSMVYGVELELTTPTSRVVRTCHVRFPGDPSSWIAGLAPVKRSSAASSSSSSLQHVREALIGTNHGPVTMDSLLRPPQSVPQTPPTVSNNGSSPAVHSDPAVQGEEGAAPAAASLTVSQGYIIHHNEPIGSGSFGRVYKAFELHSGHTVVVKETTVPFKAAASSAATAEAIASATAEFTVLTRLSHEHIVRVMAMDLVRETSTLRIFMEWVPTGSVGSVLEACQYRLHEHVLRRYARDALSGLQYLHQQGILHLDLKPSNLLVTSDGRVKLADFGTSKLLQTGASSLSTQHVIGTPAYMAPEIISSGKYFKGSDIWAWACCVVEMASGRTPWSHLDPSVWRNAVPLMFHIASSKPPKHAPVIPDHLSQQLKDILTACFSPTLSLRPSAEALLTSEYFDGEGLPLDTEQLDDYRRAASEARLDVGSGVDTAATGDSATTTGSGWTSARVYSSDATTMGSLC